MESHFPTLANRARDDRGTPARRAAGELVAGSFSGGRHRARHGPRRRVRARPVDVDTQSIAARGGCECGARLAPRVPVRVVPNLSPTADIAPLPRAANPLRAQ